MVDPVIHAGAVVVREADGERQVLLVPGPKGGPRFPWTAIEPGESRTDAARRAAREAGVDGEVVSTAGSLAFEREGKPPTHINFCLVRAAEPDGERRSMAGRWFSLADAEGELASSAARELLRNARAAPDVIHRATPRGDSV